MITGTSPEDELNLSLDEVEKNCTLEDGVRGWVFNQSIHNFRQHHKEWPAHAEEVLKSAAFVGRFAALYADFDGAAAAGTLHVTHAIHDVKKICRARLIAQGVPATHASRYQWCPGV